MKVEEKFNKKSAALLECQPPEVQGGPGTLLGVQVRLYTLPGPESRSLTLNLNPVESLKLAEDLIREARRALLPRVELVGSTG